MMKYSYLTLVLALSIQAVAQRKMSEQLYSPELKDTIHFDVLIPTEWAAWDSTQKHPSIYMLSYGVMDEGFLATEIGYFRRLHYSLPNTLVVNVEAGEEMMGYSYETGNLNPAGRNLVACIRNEVIPFVTRKYNASFFRTYIGHSQAASYAGYLFLREPGMFSGYILLAPEKIGPEQPPFHLNDSARAFCNTHTTFFYVGVGDQDMQRRRDFAREMGTELKTLDSTRCYFHYDSISLADHANILPMALELGLMHVYQLYDPGLEIEGPVTERLQRLGVRLRDVYGLAPERTAPNYQRFAGMAVQAGDSAGLKAVLAYFYDPGFRGWNLMQYGEYCAQAGLRAQAREYYAQAIRKILAEEMDKPLGPGNLQCCYWGMAFDICREDTAAGWAYLQKALALLGQRYAIPDGSPYLELGRYAALYHCHVSEGLRDLLTYVRLQGGEADGTVSLFLGRNYYWLGDRVNARRYLEYAAAQGSTTAKTWLKEIPN